MAGNLQIIPATEVDKQKWNYCIENSSNGLIYARSEYLDHMAGNWRAIVQNDYETIMPVPWKKKLGIYYCPSLPFVQQLGIFSLREKFDPGSFVDTLFSIVSYGDYFFNYKNPVGEAKTNYILPLNKEIGEIWKNVSGDAQQNLKKSLAENFDYRPGEINEAVNVFSEAYGERFPHVNNSVYARFIQLCEIFNQKHMVVVRKIVDKNNDTNAIVLLLKDNRRLYNLMNTTNDAGRKNGANHLLLYRIWQEFQESGLIFDFEGSDIPGVRKFYEKFNPQQEPYFHLHFNKLPLPLRWLKS